MPSINITKPTQGGTLPKTPGVPPTVGPIEGTLNLEDKGTLSIVVRGGLFDLSFTPTTIIPQTTQSGTLNANATQFEFAKLPIRNSIPSNCQVVVWVMWRPANQSPQIAWKIDFDSKRFTIQ
jgi:hypothetical protein